MRRFLLRMSLFVPFVLAMAAINWSVDPARLFGRTAGRALDGYEDLILLDLRAGRPHPIEDEYNRPLVLEELIRDRKNLDMLVLGSSICTPFHSDNFPGQTMVNGAVPGGDLEEAICMYELACESGRRPKRILLELHGWGTMLSKRDWVLVVANFDPIWERVLKRSSRVANDASTNGPPALRPAAELARGVRVERGWCDPYDKLISPRYMQLSLGVVVRRYVQRHSLANRDDRGNERNVLYPDGSVQWSEAMQRATPADIRKRFAGWAPVLAKMEETRTNESRRRLFESFVLSAIHSGTEVDLVLTPPLHWIYAPVERQYAAIGRKSPAAETEQEIRAFARQHHLRVFGAFDQRKTELTDGDYVDNLHIRRESMDKLLRPSSER
jgi:hypothetical protein